MIKPAQPTRGFPKISTTGFFGLTLLFISLEKRHYGHFKKNDFQYVTWLLNKNKDDSN